MEGRGRPNLKFLFFSPDPTESPLCLPSNLFLIICSIRSRGKAFVSISTDPDSGSMDDYGDVVMKLDRNKILAAGGIEVIYDDPDFWYEFPDVAKHVTGYAGEDDYLSRGGDEEFGMDFDEMVMDYEQEAEVVIPELPAEAIVSVSSSRPLSQETLGLLKQNNIRVE